MVDRVIKDIEEVLDCELSDYALSKKLGMPPHNLKKYRCNHSLIMNMRLKTAKKIQDFKDKI